MRRYQEERRRRNQCTGLVMGSQNVFMHFGVLLTLRRERRGQRLGRYRRQATTVKRLAGCGCSNTGTAEAKVLSREAWPVPQGNWQGIDGG